jgi:hypothetical protein
MPPRHDSEQVDVTFASSYYTDPCGFPVSQTLSGVFA